MAYERFWEALELCEALTSSDPHTAIGRLRNRAEQEVRRQIVAAGDVDAAIAPFGDLFRIAGAARDNQSSDEWIAPELVNTAARTFDALFEHYPPEPEPPNISTESFLESLKKRAAGEEPSASEEDDPWKPQQLGVIQIITGPLDQLPTSDMLNRLRVLDSRLTSSDRDPDQDESCAGLEIAINVKGSILFITWVISGYGDDLQPTHGDLERLLARYELAFEDTAPVSKVNSLSKQVVAELAYQRGDYTAALGGLAKAISSVVFPVWDNQSLPSNKSFPWLSKAYGRAEELLELIKHTPKRNIDWPEVENTCAVLSVAFAEDSLDGMGEDPVLDTFWNEQKGWAHAQLTPNELRSLVEERTDNAAVDRLQTYFFPDGLWQMLSGRAQQALVTADSMLVFSTLGRRSGILNEIRIATEEALHQYLWLPLAKWAEAQRSLHPGVKEILGKPEQLRRSPSIDDYVQLLWHSGAADYFRSIGLSDDDVRFLTKENRTTKHLQTLQRVRNAAEHEPGSALDSAEIRDLYAESLGIGRRGVLPSLLRLLASGKRG